MISLTGGAPRVVSPEISRRSYESIKETQPDCRAQIGARRAREMADPLTQCPAVTDDLILTPHCYGAVKHWENEYRVLDAEIYVARKEAARNDGRKALELGVGSSPLSWSYAVLVLERGRTAGRAEPYHERARERRGAVSR
jgi:hypothetical protein